MQTERITLTSEYLDISDGNTNILVQVRGNGLPVRLVFANSAPADDTTDFLVINNGDPWIYPFEVEPGSTCWARAANDTGGEIVVVKGNYGSSVVGP